jgi:hypothetical protein
MPNRVLLLVTCLVLLPVLRWWLLLRYHASDLRLTSKLLTAAPDCTMGHLTNGKWHALRLRCP